MKTIFTVIMLTLLAGITGCATTDRASDLYSLSVRFQSRYNSDFTMTTPVTTPQRVFSARKQNGDIRNSIGGALLPPRKGIYPLVITVSEWKSEEDNSLLTLYADMKLEEPISRGTINSVLSTYTITLSRNINQNAEQGVAPYAAQGAPRVNADVRRENIYG